MENETALKKMYMMIFPKADELVFKTTLPSASELPLNIPSIRPFKNIAKTERSQSTLLHDYS